MRTRFQIFTKALFAQVNHVGAEQRLSSLGEMFLTSVQKTVNPRQQLSHSDRCEE